LLTLLQLDWELVKVALAMPGMARRDFSVAKQKVVAKGNGKHRSVSIGVK